MQIQKYDGAPTCSSNGYISEILEHYDAYIVELARRKVPRNVVPPERVDDEIEELAQKVRIKLWLMLRKKHIVNLKAYINCIMYTEVVDMVRQYRSTLPLPLDDDGELYQGDMIAKLSEGMGDPAYEVEQAEALDDFAEETFEAVMRLPACQQRAMICSLKVRLDNLLPLIKVLSKHAVNIDEVNLPQNKDELKSFRSSLSIARKKLRSSKRKYGLAYLNFVQSSSGV
jgi:DNA-directed RNA polymerase specialized sigma24 family protein